MNGNDNLRIAETSNLDVQEKNQLLDLWNNEYPAKLSHRNLSEFNEYLEKLSDLKHFLLLDKQNNIGGWAFSFFRDNERWFAILLTEKLHGRGLGSKLLNKLKQSENDLCGWVIDHNRDLKKNGKPYKSPLGFYQKCGFEVLKKERLELDKISAVKIKRVNKEFPTTF